MTEPVNVHTAAIVSAYLSYAAQVVQASLTRQGYGAERFREIDDDLVIKPKELLTLIDDVQRALARADD